MADHLFEADPEPDATEEIPGTIVFDSQQSRAGLSLNNLAIALNKKTDREQFVADPEEFMTRFGLSDEQKDAVRRRDFLRMIELGGNIFFIYKIGMVDGLNVPDIVASMADQTTEEFTEMMRNGGRKPRG